MKSVTTRVWHGYTMGQEIQHCTHDGYGYIPYCNSHGVIINPWFLFLILLYPQSPTMGTRCPHKLPKCYLDLYPKGPTALPILEQAPISIQILLHVILHVKDTICTTLNSFCLMCEYPHQPSYNLDGQLSDRVVQCSTIWFGCQWLPNRFQ